MELLDFHSEPLQWHKKDLFICRISKNPLWTIRMKSVRVVEVIMVVELVRKLQGRTKGYPTSSAKLRPNFYTWGAGARGGRPVGPTSRVITKYFILN